MSDMMDKMNSDQKIQQLYNQTKDLTSPTELDDLILGKIQALDEEPAGVRANKWIYLPIAASVLLAVFLQFRGGDDIDTRFDTHFFDAGDPVSKWTLFPSLELTNNKPIEVVQVPTKKIAPKPQKNANKNQLPETFLLPNEDINRKIVPACNGRLIEPENMMDKLTAPKKQGAKGKGSGLPIESLYKNNANKKSPACDSVSGVVFKKQP